MTSEPDQISPSERKTLKRLSREAHREHRSRVGLGTLAEDNPREPRVRKLLKWLGLIAAAILLLAVIFPPFLVPVEGTVTSRFFLRTDPESIFLFDVEHHRGIDFGAPSGTTVRAARSGRVVSVTNHPSYGLMVEIRHPLGVKSRYAHLSEASVREGQWVWRRRQLGSVGMSGRATGPHLHFEIRLGSTSLPPGPLLIFHQLRRLVVS